MQLLVFGIIALLIVLLAAGSCPCAPRQTIVVPCSSPPIEDIDTPERLLLLRADLERAAKAANESAAAPVARD